MMSAASGAAMVIKTVARHVGRWVRSEGKVADCEEDVEIVVVRVGIGGRSGHSVSVGPSVAP